MSDKEDQVKFPIIILFGNKYDLSGTINTKNLLDEEELKYWTSMQKINFFPAFYYKTSEKLDEEVEKMFKGLSMYLLDSK